MLICLVKSYEKSVKFKDFEIRTPFSGVGNPSVCCNFCCMRYCDYI